MTPSIVGEAVAELAKRLRTHAKSFTFSELRRVCEHYFGPSRQKGTSHMVFKTGVAVPTIVNIQPEGKMAKAYQCRQVADAIEAKAGIKIPR